MPQFQALTTPLVKDIDRELATCSRCGAEYFEEVEALRYRRHHNLVLGQRVPVAAGDAFFFLRCLFCGALHEPKLQLSNYDAARKTYEKLFEDMKARGVINTLDQKNP